MSELDFKSPRDPHTPSCVEKIRDVLPGEVIPCFVGSGECANPASEIHDDGEGRQVGVCAVHAPQLYRLGQIVMEMTPNQISAFTELVDKAHATK